MNVTGVRSFSPLSNGRHTLRENLEPRTPTQRSVTLWIVGNPLQAMISGFLMGLLIGVYVRR